MSLLDALFKDLPGDVIICKPVIKYISQMDYLSKTPSSNQYSFFYDCYDKCFQYF